MLICSRFHFLHSSFHVLCPWFNVLCYVIYDQCPGFNVLCSIFFFFFYFSMFYFLDLNSRVDIPTLHYSTSWVLGSLPLTAAVAFTIGLCALQRFILPLFIPSPFSAPESQIFVAGAMDSWWFLGWWCFSSIKYPVLHHNRIRGFPASTYPIPNKEKGKERLFCVSNIFKVSLGFGWVWARMMCSRLSHYCICNG